MAGTEVQYEKPATLADMAAEQPQVHHLTPLELSWRPDSQSTSESAQHWRDGNTLSRQERLPLDAHGKYTVTDVDALSTIAERNLQTHGVAAPNGKALRDEMDRIIALNKDEYPDLDKNPDLLHPGMELRIHHHHKAHPAHIDIPPLQGPTSQIPNCPRETQSDNGPAPLPAAPVDAAPTPDQLPPAPQPDVRQPFVQTQSDAQPQPDVGQGIANFFGSIIGGIGGGILGAGAFDRGYDHRFYGRHWSPYTPGPVNFDQGINSFDPTQALYGQDTGQYNYGWTGGYRQPWRHHYRGF
jgi:hypothetical protein